MYIIQTLQIGNFKNISAILTIESIQFGSDKMDKYPDKWTCRRTSSFQHVTYPADKWLFWLISTPVVQSSARPRTFLYSIDVKKKNRLLWNYSVPPRISRVVKPRYVTWTVVLINNVCPFWNNFSCFKCILSSVLYKCHSYDMKPILNEA